MTDIHIHIDELILRGVQVPDRGRFMRAFRRELERGLRHALADRATARAWAATQAEGAASVGAGTEGVGPATGRRASLRQASASSAAQGRDAARALLPGEHFHLLKRVGDPEGAFSRANPEADLSREFRETDPSSPLQFFDLRVANECEQESLDEFPPG